MQDVFSTSSRFPRNNDKALFAASGNDGRLRLPPAFAYISDKRRTTAPGGDNASHMFPRSRECLKVSFRRISAWCSVRIADSCVLIKVGASRADSYV
ncbi:Hypothetical protein SMAX5B_012828 [Scophthalmus maximus]|uniref:Uncharacterized protein n=1 Tax=Scophthalmus maximus TaxID=52904 RepID=A0A2U9BYL9_SCOMX|nr:Hypothetical protein SMAX5B_012828 [Scophthalmus maximus]